MTGTAAIEKKTFKESPVWEEVITFTFASGDTAEVKQAVPIAGLLQKLVITCGSATSVETATVAIDDSSGNEIFTVAGLAEGSTNAYNLHEPFVGNVVVGVTPVNDPLSAYVVTVYMRGI